MSSVVTPVKPLEHDSGNAEIRLAPAFVPVTAPVIPAGIKPLKIKPASITHEPWTGFGPLENRTFLDDFCHQKELVIKAAASTYNGATIKLKDTVTVSKKTSKEQIKLWFPLYNRMASVLYFRLTSADTRVHYDHGINVINNHRFNFYGSFGFSRDWSKYNFKVGTQILEKNATVDNRLTVNHQKNVTLFHRTTANIDNVRLGLVAGLDITNKTLIKKDLFIGYRKDQVDVSLKAEQAFGKVTKDWKDWRQWFSKYLLTATLTRTKKQKYGVQVSVDPVAQKAVVSALVEYAYNDKAVTKIKVDQHLNIAFLVKKTLSDKLSFSFGTLFPVQKKKDQKNKFGVQFDLNL